jgi:hypothetical protein
VTTAVPKLADTLTPYDFTLGDVALLQRRAKERGVPVLKTLMTHTGCSENEGSSWLAEVKHRGLVMITRKAANRFHGDFDKLGRKDA